MEFYISILGWIIAALATAALWYKSKEHKANQVPVVQPDAAIPELGKTQALLKQKEATQNSIIYFAHSLFRQNTKEDILWDITINCIENLDFVDCVIYLYDEAKGVLVQKAAHGPKNDKNERIVDPIEIPVGKGIVGSVYQSAQAEIIEDLSLDDRYIVDDEVRSSELAVPILTPEGKVLGVIDSEHPKKGFFTSSHLEVLSTIASICAIKLIKAEADQQILLAKEAAEDATQAKSLFLTTMSHEIRTPLNAVIGLSHLLLDEEPMPHQEEHLKTLHFSAKHLLALINNILDFSKLESGKLDLDITEIDLEDLCRKVHHTFEPVSIAKKNALKLEIPAFKHHFKGDQMRLNQILTNLVGNAMKFTVQGSVTTKILVHQENEGAVDLEFQVIDTGIGIPQDRQERIFHSFEQASLDTTRRYGGTGLGLTICKRLADLMGGEISLSSEVGKGTCFSLKVRLEKGREIKNLRSNGKKPQKWKEGDLSGMKVLLVEDNPVNQKLGSKFLERWNIEVSVADHGKMALDLVGEKDDFNLILMDLNMPIMDGAEASRKIKHLLEGRDKKIPIVALTADVSPQARIDIANAKMDGALSKPFDPELLFETLAHYHAQ